MSLMRTLGRPFGVRVPSPESYREWWSALAVSPFAVAPLSYCLSVAPLSVRRISTAHPNRVIPRIANPHRFRPRVTAVPIPSFVCNHRTFVTQTSGLAANQNSRQSPTHTQAPPPPLTPESVAGEASVLGLDDASPPPPPPPPPPKSAPPRRPFPTATAPASHRPSTSHPPTLAPPPGLSGGTGMSPTAAIAAAVKAASVPHPVASIDTAFPATEPGHLYRTEIFGFGDNSFNVNGLHFRGSILAFPNFTLLWSPRSFEEVTPAHLALIPLMEPKVEMVIFGGGSTTWHPSPECCNFLAKHDIAWEPMNTFNAAATFNLLTQEQRNVCAAIIAVSETGDDVDAEMTDEQKARVASYLRIKDSPRKETDG